MTTVSQKGQNYTASDGHRNPRAEHESVCRSGRFFNKILSRERGDRGDMGERRVVCGAAEFSTVLFFDSGSGSLRSM